MIADLEEYRRRKAKAALMFAERALDDASRSYQVEPDGRLASAIGHLRLAVVDLRDAQELAEAAGQ